MILRKGSIPDQSTLKAMDDYHLLFSLRPSEPLFVNQLHLIVEGGGIQSCSGVINTALFKKASSILWFFDFDFFFFFFSPGEIANLSI